VKRIWGLLVVLVLFALAIPPLLMAVETILPYLIMFVVFIGIASAFLYRRRYW
jgi:hypothetical protein